MRIAVPIQLTDEERQTLTRWARGRRTPARLVLRAKIVLHAAEGLLNKDIAVTLQTDRRLPAPAGSSLEASHQPAPPPAADFGSPFTRATA